MPTSLNYFQFFELGIAPSTLVLMKSGILARRRDIPLYRYGCRIPSVRVLNS